MIPHGTITGHAAGCKSDVNCPMAYEKPYAQRTCLEVALMYRRDYQFIKKIDAGMTPAEILAAEKVAEAEALAARIAAKEAAIRERKARAVAEKRANAKAPRAPGEHVHGTPHGAVRGCKSETDCPGIAEVGVSCVVARREYHNGRYRARKAKAAA